MTPMIDVVFLLVIFFLVTSHLSDQETQIELNLPKAINADRPETETSQRITFNIPRSNQILWSGKTVSLDDIEQLVQKVQSEYGNDTEVRIRTDKAVDYSTVSPLLRICAENGIWNVSFSVERRGQE